MKMYRTGKENLITREEEYGNPPGSNGQSVEWECGCTLKKRCHTHVGQEHPAFCRPVVLGYGEKAIATTYDYVEAVTGKRPMNNGAVYKFLEGIKAVEE